MKSVKVFFLGLLFLSASILIIKTAKIISIPQDPPDGKAYADFFPHPGWPIGKPPPVAAKKPDYFPPFPPPVEHKSTLVAAKTKGEKKGGAASSG